MLPLEKIQEKLKDRRLRIVAAETGLHHNTVYLISKGKGNPTYETMKKLSDYLEAK